MQFRLKRDQRGIAVGELIVAMTVFGILVTMLASQSLRMIQSTRQANSAREAAAVLAWYAADLENTGSLVLSCPQEPLEPVYQIGPDKFATRGGFAVSCDPSVSSGLCPVVAPDTPDPDNCWKSWPPEPCDHVNTNTVTCDTTVGLWSYRTVYKRAVKIKVSWSVSGCNPTIPACLQESLPTRTVWLV